MWHIYQKYNWFLIPNSWNLGHITENNKQWTGLANLPKYAYEFARQEKYDLLEFDYEQPVFASKREHPDDIEFDQNMGLGRQVAGVCNTVGSGYDSSIMYSYISYQVYVNHSITSNS